jgi:hypothetical protein
MSEGHHGQLDTAGGLRQAGSAVRAQVTGEAGGERHVDPGPHVGQRSAAQPRPAPQTSTSSVDQPSMRAATAV